MKILQTFESTILDQEDRHEFHVLVVPARSMFRQFEAVELRTFLELDEDAAKPLRASNLPNAIIAMFAAEYSSTPVEQLRAYTDGSRAEETTLIPFAEYVSFAKVIPFEQSPLTPTSLAEIAIKLAKGGSIATGVFVGISAGNTPMLLVTVPAGIVICGVGISFVKWLEKNSDRIYDRLLGFHAPARPRKARESKAGSGETQVVPKQIEAEGSDAPQRSDRKRLEPPESV
jgi:hypothetical protein